MAPARSARHISYDSDDPAKLLLGPEDGDVPRNRQGIALVGDPRNDVHLFMNQMQVGFIRLHNRLVDRLRDDGVREAELFEEARRAATWHYQWVILREFLPVLIGPELTESCSTSARTSTGPATIRSSPSSSPTRPIATATARSGRRYQVNAELGPVPVFPDLIGFCEVPAERMVDWSLLFDVPGTSAGSAGQTNRRPLPESLIALPRAISGVDESDAYASLANRDLQRGQAIGLPSGEAVARALGADPLSSEQVGLGEHGWRAETPLWIYVLREANALQDGDRLGPVGGHIVGEVLVGIIDADPESFRSVDRSWTPSLPSHDPDRFGIADVLAPAD